MLANKKSHYDIVYRLNYFNNFFTKIIFSSKNNEANQMETFYLRILTKDYQKPWHIQMTKLLFIESITFNTVK